MTLNDFNKAKNLLDKKKKLEEEIENLEKILSQYGNANGTRLYMDTCCHPFNFKVDFNTFQVIIQNEVMKKQNEIYRINEEFNELGEKHEDN